MSYILIVDDEEDIRDIYEMLLRRIFPLEIILADSGNEALKVISDKGDPKIIISDLNMPNGDGYFLWTSLKEKRSKVPFVICSSDAIPDLKKRFPDIHGYVEKPDIMDSVIGLINKVISPYENPPQYVPVRISILLRWGGADYDLFMKLSPTKFVKVIHAGEALIPEEANRFRSKGIEFLYITAADAESYVKKFAQNISMVIDSEEGEELSLVSLESLEAVSKISSSLGWTDEVLTAAKHAVNLAVKAVSREPNIVHLLKKKLSGDPTKFTEHISKLALLSCAFCHQLGWTTESTQMKLGMAALVHDIALDDSYYEDINYWNELAKDLENRSPEVVKYRNHPLEASSLIMQMRDLPPDVNQIILQHHESKDGNGFPRGLVAGWISPLTSVFIIVEDLLDYLDGEYGNDERLREFIKTHEGIYDSGNFKKIFDVLKYYVEN